MISHFFFEIKSTSHFQHQFNSNICLLKKIREHCMLNNPFISCFKVYENSFLGWNASLFFVSNVSLFFSFSSQCKSQALHHRTSFIRNSTFKDWGMWFPKIESFVTFFKILPIPYILPRHTAHSFCGREQCKECTASKRLCSSAGSWWMHAYTWDQGRTGWTISPSEWKS